MDQPQIVPVNDVEFTMLIEAKKKQGWIAALLNLVVPGAGYWYCDRRGLGVLVFFFVLMMVCMTFGIAWLFLAPVVVIDGFLCAGRYNKALVERMVMERRTGVRATDADRFAAVEASNQAALDASKRRN